jgi:hypothetical protein
MYRFSLICLCFVIFAGTARASDNLLYFEGQEIFGYSSVLGKTVAYSRNPEAEMQKPSLGFDYLQRFSGESGDVATVALQFRIAATRVVEQQNYKYEPTAPQIEQDGFKSEPQIYNAYLKVKTPWTYVWIGHNRPAFGIAYSLDSHGLLLQTLEMRFGYDRDWGVGAYKDFSWGDISLSATSGTGMPLYQNSPELSFDSHFMDAARVSYGVLSRDNFNVGFSLGSGRTLETVGYTLMNVKPLPMRLAGTDLTILRNNFEHRFDLLYGEWLGRDTVAVFYRFGVNLDQEGRFKIETQPMYWKYGLEEDYQVALCFSVLATSNWTIRTEYLYDDLSKDNRFLVQLYYYSPI